MGLCDWQSCRATCCSGGAVVLRSVNQSSAGREGLARLGCNQDLKVGYN